MGGGPCAHLAVSVVPVFSVEGARLKWGAACGTPSGGLPEGLCQASVAASGFPVSGLV